MRALGALALVGAAACAPAAALDDLSDAELCGLEQVELELSPAPRAVRRSGARLALAGPVAVRGEALAGALEDALAALGLAAGEGGAVLRFEDAAALAVAARRCGADLDAGPEAYLLAVRERGGAAEVLIAGAPPGQAHALATLRQLARDGQLPQVAVFDGPRVPRRAVIEGFYGAPWTWGARRELVQFAAAHKLNTYYLAPKGDLLSGIGWRGDYPEPMRREARALVAFARDRGVELCWAVSPGTDIIYSSAAHRQAMVAKLDGLAKLGVRCFVLAFDDVPKVLQAPDQALGLSFAAVQLDFVATMHAHLRGLDGATLAFVPTDYSTRMMLEDPAYADAVAGLDRSISVGWTGPEVISARVTAADAAFAAARFGRPVVLGDNYPVRDNAPDSGPLMLQPIDGREPGAFAQLQGYGGNGMVLPRASMVALASLAELAWNPEGYRPARALAWGARSAAGTPAPAEALRFLADHAEGLNTGPAACAPALRGAIVAAELDPAAAQPALEAHFRQMAQLGAALAGADPRLRAELEPWIAKLEGWGALGVELLALRSGARPGTRAEVEALRAELARLLAMRAQIADAVMKDFAEATLAGGT